jgi:hypothetical protein
MRINTLFVPLAALMLTACATAPSVPLKRPMTVEAKTQIGSTDLNAVANQNGMGASWFMTQSNGGGAGLGGVIGAAIADAIINHSPAKRAKNTANEVAESIALDDLNDSLMNALNAGTGASEEGVTISTISMIDGLQDSAVTDGTVVLKVNYMLAEDASAFKATATAYYEDADLPYVPPYVFEKKVPKAHRDGPVYRNDFVFNSSQFPQPVLTDALKEELVKAVEESYRDEDGNLPTEGSDFKKLQKDIEDARDDKLKKSETAIFLVQRWLENDAEPMKAELSEAHSFFAKYLVADLNATDIPAFEGTDKVVETLESGRVVKVLGSGLEAGTYISEPGNVSSFTTYGNAVKFPNDDN